MYSRGRGRFFSRLPSPTAVNPDASSVYVKSRRPPVPEIARSWRCYYKNRGLWTEIALRAVCWQKEYFERPNFISRPKRKLVENNDDNRHHPHHQRANIVTGSPGLLCANNCSRSLRSCRNWKPIDEGKFVMKSAYTRLKVPTSILQTLGIGQERLRKGREGGIQFMQLLDVPPAFVLFCQNWLIWWRTGTPWTHS